MRMFVTALVVGIVIGGGTGWALGVHYAAWGLARRLNEDREAARQVIEDLGARHGFRLQMFQLPSGR